MEARLAEPLDAEDPQLPASVSRAVQQGRLGWLPNPTIELVLKEFKAKGLPVSTAPPTKPPSIYFILPASPSLF